MIELKGKNCKDCVIFTDNVEDSAMSTIYGILDSLAFKDKRVRIMPDVHDGSGIVVGFSSQVGDYINPNHIGCDIGCMVSTVIFDKLPKDISDIEREIRELIPFGPSLHSSNIINYKDFYKFMSDKTGMIVDEKVVDEIINRVGMNGMNFFRALGTVGGGNHFIEIGKSAETGQYGLTIHTGSRNFGLKVYKYWDTVSKNKGRKEERDGLREITEKVRSSASNKEDLPDLISSALKDVVLPGYLHWPKEIEGYLRDLNIAQAYASYNHKVIRDRIMSGPLRGVKVIEIIETRHNYIDLEDKIIRKGAIRSYIGEKMIIPFNMRDGLAVCTGKSNPDWNFTAPHGAGRVLSRSEAREIITESEFIESMKGIYSTTVGRSTIDESPMVYKDFNEICELIKPTCDILYFIKPVMNIKASE